MLMKKAQVILLSILAACGYGIIHDQITVRLCIEYLTIAHPALFPTTSPTLLAFCWGIAATAPIGVAFGVILALVSQPKGQLPIPVSQLARQILVLLGAMGLSALTAGSLGQQLAQRGFIAIPADFATVVPVQQHDNFLAVWFAHAASYFVGLVVRAVVFRTQRTPPLL